MPARVLIIDPVATNRILLKAGLSSGMMQAVAAESDAQAIALLRAFRPDLIVLDAAQPGMREGTLIRDIRSQPAGLDVPIIAIGTPERPEQRLGLLRLGADEILPKPVDIPLLRDHVLALLRRRDRTLAEATDRHLWALTEGPATFATPRRVDVVSQDRALIRRCISGVSRQGNLTLRACTQISLGADAVLVPHDSPVAQAELAALLADPDRAGVAKIVLVPDSSPATLRNVDPGADGAVPMDVSDAEIAHRIEVLIAHAQRRARHRNHLRDGWKQALTDPLTGLPNRRHALAQLGHWQRQSEPFWIGLADLDHFKAVNDRHGHITGDRVLATIAGLMRAHMEPNGFAARLGGEEFLLLWSAPHAPQSEAEALLQTVALARPAGVSATMSIGLVPWHPASPQDADGLLAAADRALYRAKRAGRNRLIMDAAAA
jgi:two-component system cell cycle response regulator